MVSSLILVVVNRFRQAFLDMLAHNCSQMLLLLTLLAMLPLLLLFV